MTHEHEEDRDLRDRFAAERSVDATRVPSLGRVLAPRTRRRLLLRPAFALGAMAVIIASVALWRGGGAPASTSPFTVAPGELRVPTDYFLEVGATVVRAGQVPAIGTVNWYPLMPEPDASSRRN